MRVCVFGDSIAWGAWDEEKGGWVERLNHHLTWGVENYENEVYNLGVSGNTTSDLIKRFKAEAKARNPDVIIFSAGLNDSAYIGSEDKPLVSLEKFKSNVSKLIKGAKVFTKNMIFVGLYNFDDSKTKPVWWMDGSYSTKRTELYKNELKKICKENKVLFLEVWDLLSEKDFWDDDPVHPNASGHKKICDEVISLLKKNKLV